MRIANGYRVYTEDYLIKIKFIKDTKLLGFSLKEIQEVLNMLSQDMDADILRGLVHKKICEIEERIESLHSIQSMLSGLLETSDEEVDHYLKSFRSPGQ